MMEAYKGDTKKSIYKSLGVLAKYPRQVIVLQNTGMCMQRRVGPQMANRLIWKEHTDTFPTFVREIASAKAGDEVIEESLLWRGHEANARMQGLLDGAASIMEGNKVMLQSLTAGDISAIRGSSLVPPDILLRIFSIASDLAEGFRQSFPNPIVAAQGKSRTSDFLFRVGLAMTCWFLDWVRTGGPTSVKPEKIRNDYVDAMISVYGSYFNGIMTGDAKLQRVGSLNRHLLEVLGARLSRPYAQLSL